METDSPKDTPSHAERTKELIAYLIFGVLTTLINYVVYVAGILVFHIDYITSNWLAWFVAVLFAFFTNKRYVFHSLSWDKHLVFRELWQFISARIFAVLVETALLWLFVTVLGYNELYIKIFTNVVVVVLNYVASKWIIFKDRH